MLIFSVIVRLSVVDVCIVVDTDFDCAQSDYHISKVYF